MIFDVELESLTPMLQHRMPEDELFALLGTKEKQKKPKEVQLPRDIAEKYAYKNCDHYLLPMDYDGLVSSFKVVIDALRHCRILADDKIQNIGVPDYRWEKAPRGQGGVKVIVEGVE